MNENNQQNNDKQDDTSNKSCCCKKLFDTSNLCKKILISIAAIILALYVYNKTMTWYGCSQIEKISKELILIDNDFGWLTLRNRPIYVDDLDSVNNKMLLLYMIKQQKEILINQKNIESKIASNSSASYTFEPKPIMNQTLTQSNATTAPIITQATVEKPNEKENANMQLEKNKNLPPKITL